MTKSERYALAADLITDRLAFTKLDTMRKAYTRLAPWTDGRIRTKLSTSTETGRIASRGDDWWPEPSTNLQNLTNRAAVGDDLFKVRNVIIPDPGKVLICGDLKQAELYGYLARARDWEKLDKLISGVDLHREISQEIYGLPADEITYNQRAVGKFANFSLGYEGGWKMFMGKVNKLADQTGISITAGFSKDVVNTWRAKNWKTVASWVETKQLARRDGYLVNSFGRKRVVYGSLDGSVSDLVAFLPQSDIADHLNGGLALVFDEEERHGLFEVLLQVHDEVVIQADKSKAMAAARVLKRCLERPITIQGRTFTIPVEVSMSGLSWEDCKEIEV